MLQASGAVPELAGQGVLDVLAEPQRLDRLQPRIDAPLKTFPRDDDHARLVAASIGPEL